MGPTATGIQQAKVVRVVDITVDSSGGFTYSMDPLHAQQGDSIQWKSNGNFAVRFKGVSPCDRVDYFGPNGQDTGVVTTNAPNGIYPYTVAVVGANGRIFIDDPQIIIP